MGSQASAPGYFPLWLTDLEQSTLGWNDDMRFKYLRVLSWLRHEGGFMPADDATMMHVAGINPGRGSKERLDQIKDKLTKVTFSTEDVETGKALRWDDRETGREPTLLEEQWWCHPRICRDLQKRLDIRVKKQEAGRKGGLSTQAKKPPPPEDDETTVFWKENVSRLTHLGLDEQGARRNIGKWLKDYPEHNITKAADAAVQAATHDPIPYITRALKNISQGYGNRARRPAI